MSQILDLSLNLTFSSRIFTFDSRIGKGAIALLERFKITDRISDCYFSFYAGVAMPVENFQLCADKLTQAFSSGLSHGNFNLGILCIAQAYYVHLFCGKNLR